jgi:hypothetical protein
MKTVVATVLMLAGTAVAGPTFYAFQENTLHRVNADTSVDVFTLSGTMISSAVNPAGEIVGVEGRGQRPHNTYRLNDPLGSPSLVTTGQTMNPVNSLTFVGNRAFGFDNLTADFVELDPVTLDQINNFGNLGFPGSVGIGYDSGNDTIYAINRTTDELWAVDYHNATASLVGSLGVDIQNGGAEFFGGTLYLANQNLTTGFYEIGTVNVLTGAYTTLYQLGTFPDPNVQTQFVSLSIIPAPGGVAVLGLAGLAAARRRR